MVATTKVMVGRGLLFAAMVVAVCLFSSCAVLSVHSGTVERISVLYPDGFSFQKFEKQWSSEEGSQGFRVSGLVANNDCSVFVSITEATGRNYEEIRNFAENANDLYRSDGKSSEHFEIQSIDIEFESPEYCLIDGCDAFLLKAHVKAEGACARIAHLCVIDLGEGSCGTIVGECTQETYEEFAPFYEMVFGSISVS